MDVTERTDRSVFGYGLLCPQVSSDNLPWASKDSMGSPLPRPIPSQVLFHDIIAGVDSHRTITA